MVFTTAELNTDESIRWYPFTSLFGERREQIGEVDQ